MKVLLLSYGVIDYDGRLIELFDIANKLGDVTLICCGIKQHSTNKKKIVNVSKYKHIGFNRYFLFVIKSLVYAVQSRNIDVLIVDNYFAAFVALIIKRICNVNVIVQDVRELYFIEDIKSWSGRMLVKSEVKLMKQADIVMSANKYRSEIMYEHYKLNQKPIVFENIRFLTENYNKADMENRYKTMFSNRINIISSGGISVKRGTKKLVEAMKELSSDYSLYIVGGGSKKDIEEIEKTIKRFKLNNVQIINKVPLSELRYIVQQCDIGIVHYHSEDLNNRYCASGKIYEYLAEGLPIVTTENIPLKEFCLKYEVGVADNSFYKGIQKVSEDISQYRERVDAFASQVSVEKYNTKIAKKILKIIKSEANETDE